MEFTVNQNSIFTLLEWHKSLIKNDIPSEIFISDMHRRAKYCVEAPCEKYVLSKREELLSRLKQNGVSEIPGTIGAFTNFVGSRNDLDLKPCSMDLGCPLVCNNITIHTVPKSYLRIGMTLTEKTELEYIKGQIEWVYTEKIKGCLRRMHLEWDPKLASRGLNIPLDDEAFVNLVISQPDYKDRSARDAESQPLGDIP